MTQRPHGYRNMPKPAPAAVPLRAFPVAAAAVAAVVAAATLAAAPASAQINTRTLTLAGVSDCLAEAVATKSVDEDGIAIVFSCTDAKARTLYNFLGRRIQTEVVEDRNGKFENRAFGNSACYHRIVDQSGHATDEFRCDLVIAVGEALGERLGE